MLPVNQTGNISFALKGVFKSTKKIITTQSETHSAVKSNLLLTPKQGSTRLKFKNCIVHSTAARKELGQIENNFAILQTHLRESNSLITDNGEIINQKFLDNYGNESEFFDILFKLHRSDKIKTTEGLPNIRIGEAEIKFTKVLGFGGTKVVLEGEIVSGEAKGTKVAVFAPSTQVKEVKALAELRELGIGCNDFSELVIAKSTKDGLDFPLMLMKPYNSHEFQVYDSKNMVYLYHEYPSIKRPLERDIKDAKDLLQTDLWKSMVDEVLDSFQKNVGIFGGDSLSLRRYPDGKWGFYILDIDTSDICKNPFPESDLAEYAEIYAKNIFNAFLQIAGTDNEQHPKLWELYEDKKQLNSFTKQFADLVVKRAEHNKINSSKND